ncbi:hypothetical protein DL96DRAFT_38232 [Flagelloscypha sp. PMI_526]|nr:hypothetical protein DL96DRAFT_38232 [Flagelloscypha sp. PMI_526]
MANLWILLTSSMSPVLRVFLYITVVLMKLHDALFLSSRHRGQRKVYLCIQEPSYSISLLVKSFPETCRPFIPGQPPRNGSSQPASTSCIPDDTISSPNKRFSKHRLIKVCHRILLKLNLAHPVPRQQPQGSSSTQPGPIPNNDRVPIPANFFPRHSFPPGTMEPILPPREQALTASDTAPTNTSVHETVPAVDVTPPPPIPVKASGTGQNDAPAQASQTITVRNARPSLMPPTPTESIESASVYDPADLYGGIEDDQPAESPSVNRRASRHIRYPASSGVVYHDLPEPSFQPKLPSVIESSVANQPAPFARHNMSVPALAKENIHSVSPSNHEARSLANPQSNPPPLPHNQSSSTIGSYTSSGHSTSTAQPPPYASHMNHSAPTRLGADYRPQNPHLPKHLVMPSPLQQQQQPSRQPQNVPPERRSSAMYYPHQQPLQPSLEPPLQPVLQPVMHRDDHRVRQSPSPHNMSRAQQIPIYEHPDVTSSSKKLLRKRSSVAGMPPPGSGKHASIPPNMPLDFSADIGLRQKVPTRSTSDKRPPPSTTGGQGTGKPLRRYLSKRRHES